MLSKVGHFQRVNICGQISIQSPQISISSISRKKRSLTGSSQNTKFDNATTANNEIPENFVKSKPYDEMTDKEIQDEETALTTIVFKGTVQGT